MHPISFFLAQRLSAGVLFADAECCALCTASLCVLSDPVRWSVLKDLR
jgi:hypothetical protein